MGCLSTAETKEILEGHIKARAGAGEHLRYQPPAEQREATSSQDEEGEGSESEDEDSFRSDTDGALTEQHLGLNEMGRHDEPAIETNTKPTQPAMGKDEKFGKILEQNILINNQDSKERQGGRDKNKKKTELSPKGLDLLRG